VCMCESVHVCNNVRVSLYVFRRGEVGVAGGRGGRLEKRAEERV
jgi:hypothetical protein